jgi:flagellar hook assembly protein FlgD
MKGGSHEITWDGTNSINKRVGSGIYFIKLRTEKCVNVKKIVKLDL